jgi:hypothetical protein
MNNGCQSAKPSHAQLGRPNMYHSQQHHQPTNRALFASTAGIPHCHERYKTNMLARTGNQGFNNLSRAHYNPVCLKQNFESFIYLIFIFTIVGNNISSFLYK